jgi:hypothetical protein
MDFEPIPPGIVRAGNDVSIDLAELLDTLTAKDYPVGSVVTFLQVAAGLVTDDIANPNALARAEGHPRGKGVSTAHYLEWVDAIGPACPAYSRIDWNRHRQFKL